jgi:hypothetical protein
MKKLRLFLLSFFFLTFMGLSFAETPKEVRIVDVTDASFTVVWYTDQAEQGYIEWGSLIPNTTAYDLRGSSVSDNIHIVVVNGLILSTDYVFQIKSGGITYLNDTKNFTVKTANDSMFDAPSKISFDKVYKVDSINTLVSNDVLIFARAINDQSEYSIPQVILYKNAYNKDIDGPKGYRNRFIMNSFRDKDGKPLPSPIVSVELVAWTASEGFGFNDVLTINYVPAAIDIYLNTANLVFYAGGTTTNPVIPTVDPVTPTPNPTSNVTSVNGLLLENFETDISAFTTNEFGGYNYPYRNDDSLWGYAILNEGANGTTKSYRQNYILQGTSYVYSGYGLDLKPSKAEMDLSTFGAIRFFAKGSGQLAVELETTKDVISNENHYFNAVTLSDNWKEYVISFSYFSQDDWGIQVDLITALKRMIAIKFKAYPQVAGTNGWFQIDELYLVTGDAGSIPAEINDGFTLDNFDKKWNDANFFGGYNYVYDDAASPNFGNSIVTLNESLDGANGSKKSVLITYNIKDGFVYPFIGFGLDITQNAPNAVTKNTIDLSIYKGIEFYVKGDNRLAIQIGSPLYTTWNDYAVDLGDLNSGWTLYRIPFSDFRQPKWGEQITFNNVMQIADSIKFKASEMLGEGSFMVDQIRFVTEDIPSILVAKVSTLNIATTEGSLDRTLSWTLPAGATGVIVIRTTSNYAMNVNEGTKVYQGALSTIIDNSSSLDYMINYIYTVYSYNSAKRYSEPVTASSVLFVKDTLITDFDKRGLDVNAWSGAIYSYNDNGTPNFGNSEVTMNITNNAGSKALFVSYDVNNAASNPFVGIGFGLDVITNNTQDISRFSGVQFKAKVSADIRLEIDSPIYLDYNRHSYQFTVTNVGTWNIYKVYFSDMVQDNSWGTKVALIDVLKKALAVQLKIGKTNDNGQIIIDDVSFLYGTPQDVQHLSANIVGHSSKLNWNSSIGANGYYVVRNVTTYPYSGTFPISKTEGKQFLVTGNTFTEPMITNDVYYYSVFAYNDNNLGMYSGVTTADKALMILDGGLFSYTPEITVNETIHYVQGSSPTLSVRNGDYVSRNLTLIVTVDTEASITHSFTLVVKSKGVTLNDSVTVTASVSSNVVVISLNLIDAGINDLQIFAIANWLVDGQSNIVNKVLMVADATSVVTLKPGSRVLCYPMPYDPNSIDPMDIAYELTAESDVSIYVYNLLGQVVWKNLYYKGFEGGNAGYNQVSFNGVDAFGDKLAIGMYFIQIVHGKSVLGTSKFLVTRK